MASSEVAAPFPSLATELLFVVFESGLPCSTLLNCMLCCRAWYHLARPALYHDIVLTNSTIRTWLRQSPTSTDEMIRTFTLRIRPLHRRPDGRQDIATRESLREIRNLRDCFEKLATRIQNLTKLASFSLCHTTAQITGCWIPGDWLLEVVDGLSESCVSVEIDTRGDEDRSGSGHLCESIRRLLPRLHYLRLRLKSYCPEICGVGTDFRRPYAVAESFTPTLAPHLRQCIINIHLHGMGTSLVCRTRACFGSGIFHDSMVRHLEVFASGDNTPALEKLWVLDARPRRPENDPAGWASFVRWDVAARKSVALPARNMGDYRQHRDGWLIRLPQEEAGGDYVSSMPRIETLAEGHAWQEAANGARLPAPIMALKGLAPVLPVFPKEDPRARERSESARVLWGNEARVGTKLVEVQEGELFEVRFVQEIIPPGWRRVQGGFIWKDYTVR